MAKANPIPNRTTVWARKNPERMAANRKRWKEEGRTNARTLKYRYGMTNENYDTMLAAQGGVCSICALAGTVKEEKHALCVDHDHKTGAVRGLVCRAHNFLLGFAHDNLTEISAAYYYLKHYQTLQGGIP